jgi:hypothetical protein
MTFYKEILQFFCFFFQENIVFINDIKIERRTKTELKFGDFLQLGEKPMSNRNNNQVRKADRLRNMMSQRSSKFLFTVS